MSDFWQYSESSHDSFLTHFLLLIHIWDIYKTFLTELWQIFESDTFLTDIWHNSDGFLTDFWNWQFSDRFLTDIWHIFETFGTYIEQEYRLILVKPSNSKVQWIEILMLKDSQPVISVVGWSFAFSKILSTY